MVALVATEAFRISLERQDNPFLLGQPVAIMNGGSGAIVLEASSEAQMMGVRKGMTWAEAHQHCPGCMRVSANHSRYTEVSGRIMDALREISPEIEPVGPGEIFLDLTRCQSYYRHQPDLMGRLILDSVRGISGLSCSVGISGDKTTARWAARQRDSNGLTVIPPGDAENVLRDVPLAELCGLGPEVAAFFASYGVIRCGDMRKIPVSVPAKHFGGFGRRLWMMALGSDPSPIRLHCPEPGTLSIGKVLPPGTRDLETLQEHFLQMSGKLATRLSREGLAVRDFHIGILCPEGWRQARLVGDDGDCNTHGIARLCRRFLKHHWFGEVVQQIRLQAAPAKGTTWQQDFFAGDAAPPPSSLSRQGKAWLGK